MIRPSETGVISGARCEQALSTNGSKAFHEKAGERQVISFFFSLFFIPRVFHRKTSRQDGLAATIASSV
ncbi:MAG: hypothetical protein WCD68_01770, partial [Candidatus Acidiferrum sp.]